jgi:hypothetical protein
MRPQGGIEFYFRKDWKDLFRKDTWFEWKREYYSDRIILKRFNLWNVGVWYFYRLMLKIIIQFFRPIIRTAERYWYDWPEGSMYKVIPGEVLHQGMEIKYYTFERTNND